MSDPRNTVARMIRTTPDAMTPEGSEELAERVIRVVRALDETPMLEAPRHTPRPTDPDPVQVTQVARRIQAMTEVRQIGEDESSTSQRLLRGLWELVEEVGERVVAGALRRLREEIER